MRLVIGSSDTALGANRMKNFQKKKFFIDPNMFNLRRWEVERNPLFMGIQGTEDANVLVTESGE